MIPMYPKAKSILLQMSFEEESEDDIKIEIGGDFWNSHQSVTSSHSNNSIVPIVHLYAYNDQINKLRYNP